MSLELVLGKSKSGKSQYLYDKIDENLNSSNNILFVPSQFRMVTEENYINYQQKSGIINLNITTMSEYIKSNLKNLNLYTVPNYINKIDKKLIINKVINDNLNLFKMFSKVKTKPGFIDMIDIYIDMFRKEFIKPDNILNLKLEDKILEMKLKELGEIYKKYIDYINVKFKDDIDESNMFVEELLKTNSRLENNFKTTNLYFDNYNNFTKNEIMIIESFMKKGYNLTIAIDTDAKLDSNILDDLNNDETDDMFFKAKSTISSLIRLANSNGIKTEFINLNKSYSKSRQDLRYLSENIFKSEKITKVESNNIKIKLLSNPKAEIEKVAKKIIENVNNEIKYKDQIIYVSDVEEYQEIIKNVFYNFNIPFYIQSKANILNNPLTNYISKLLEAATDNFNMTSLIELLKLDLLNINKSDIWYFENYILEFGIKSYNLNSELKFNNSKYQENIYDLKRINIIRNKINSIIKTIKDLSTDNILPSQIVKIIYDHLINKKILKNYEKLKTEIEALDTVESIFIVKIYEQVSDKLNEIFDSICKIYMEEKIPLKEFKSIFNRALELTNLDTIQPTLDQIQIADINLGRFENKKNVFWIGINDGKFPKNITEDLLFSDLELKKLDTNLINFKENTSIKKSMQIFNIYKCLASVEQELYITIPTSDSFGKSLRISNIITDILQVVNLKIEGEVTKKIKTTKITENINNNLFEIMCNIAKRYNLNDKEIEELEKSYFLATYSNILSNNKLSIYNRLISYLKNDNNISDNTINNIYKEDINMSVSRLEAFKSCPFSYYLNYVLTLKPRKVFKVSSMDIGNFFHAVIEEFSKYLFENNIFWQSLLLNNNWNFKLNEIITLKLEKEMKNHQNNIRFNVLKKRLINSLNKIILVIAKSFNQSEYIPFGYEIEFNDKSSFIPMEIKLDENKTMYIKGKIDRVDILETEDKIYARVIDYKSSSKELKIDDIKEGISLQLITYLSSFISNIQKTSKKMVIPSGMIYINLSNNLINFKSHVSDSGQIEKEIQKSLRMKGIFLNDVEILKRMDKNLDNDERMIDVSTRSITQNTNKVLFEEDYLILCKEIESILKEIGNEIIKGNVRIKPNLKKEACKYCDYSSTCRKNSCV